MEELIRAIEANPDDPAAYAVYGDYLLEKGDPLGEIVVLSHASAAERDPVRRDEMWAALQARQKDYLEKCFPEFAWQNDVYFYWHHGFVYWVEAVTNLGREVFDGISSAPVTRFLQAFDLTVRQMDRRSSWVDPDDTTNPLPLMIERGFPRTLRRADLSFEMLEESVNVPAHLEPLFPKLQQVEELSLGYLDSLGAIDLPNLKRLTVRESSPDQMKDLARARWPALEMFAFDGPWDRFAGFALAAPKLHTLRLCASSGPDFRSLAAAPIVRQVRSVDFQNAITRNTVDALFPVLSSFVHLETIRLWPKELDPPQLEALKNALGPRLVLT